MEVYHGGYSSIEASEMRAGRYAKEFGIGFYCTELHEQAMRWARRYDTPTVTTYSSKAHWVSIMYVYQFFEKFHI